MNLPELLAPAGSIETFWAGFNAGADAFYMGFGEFNARKRAKNLTDEELFAVAELSHKQGKKIYITLNTLVFDYEIEKLLKMLETVKELKADAVIVQDWGVLSLIKRFYPEIPVHSSTQMFCHNSFHAEFLKANGVKRIILPRELSISEIKSIMEKVPLEYEVFIHGAMCFSFSGCCLFSSYLFGDSGNRGECRQLCRFQYVHNDKICYPFSMRDLDASEFMEKLFGMGFAAFKIEGRLKNAEYVSETVSYYRSLIDSLRDGKPIPRKTNRNQKYRETACGYLSSNLSYSDAVQKESKGTMGENIGKVVSVSGKEILISFHKPPFKGMRLRIQDNAGKNIHEGTFLDFQKEKSTGENEIILWKIPQNIFTRAFKQPFTVYCTGKSEQKNVFNLIKAKAGKIVKESFSLELIIQPESIHIKAVNSISYENRYYLETSPPKNISVTPENCREIFYQIDKYPFRIGEIKCRIDENLFVPLSSLKSVKRTFYADLYDFFVKQRAGETERKQKEIMDLKKNIIEKNKIDSPNNIKYFSYSDLPVNSEKKAEIEVFPVDLFEIPAIAVLEKTFLLLPFFVSESNTADCESWIRKLIEKGYKNFMIQTYGWLTVLKNYHDLKIMAGPFLYIVNSFSADFFGGQNVRYFTGSTDIEKNDLNNLDSFRGRLYPVNPPKEVFVTRMKIPFGSYFLKNRCYMPYNKSEYTVLREEEPG